MLGIDYGSDSDSSPPPSPKPKPAMTAAVKSKPKGPKKITISLPALSAATDDNTNGHSDERPAKKQRTGAGSSSLTSMLPAPKKITPVAPQRILGGGSGPGLVFSKPSAPAAQDSTNHANDGGEESPPSISFRPTNVGRGRKNVSVEETSIKASPLVKPQLPAVDFFSLGETKSTSSSTSATASSSSLLPGISAAPQIETYEPPEPTQTDPYPGYYQLPSGSWAAYDADYYKTFMDKWQKEYNAHIRALERGRVKGFEVDEDASLQEVDALKEMEKAKVEIQEREERKALTRGADGGPVAPKMKITASKMSGIARSRHQLSTLLRDAYENRESLEEQIAQGRRNRKEAGNKYGF